jgi:hypothetical protein
MHVHVVPSSTNGQISTCTVEIIYSRAVHFNSTMASYTFDDVARTSVDFVQSSMLEAIVPANETVNVKSLFAEWTGEAVDHDDSLLPFVEQRHFLLLGMWCLVFTSEFASYSFTGIQMN